MTQVHTHTHKYKHTHIHTHAHTRTHARTHAYTHKIVDKYLDTGAIVHAQHEPSINYPFAAVPAHEYGHGCMQRNIAELCWSDLGVECAITWVYMHTHIHIHIHIHITA